MGQKTKNRKEIAPSDNCPANINRARLIILSGLAVLFSLTTIIRADSDWQMLETNNFEIFYKSGNENKAREALSVLTAYRDEVKKLSGKEIKKLRIVIEDIGMFSNGFSDPLNPNIHLFTYPPSANLFGLPILGLLENWWRSVGTHEAIHIGQLTQSGGTPGILTTAFGNVFSPNLLVPDWIAEGVTTSGESQLSPYEGRVNNGLWDSVLASQRSFPTLLEMTYVPLNFPSIAGGAYLYGGKFFAYLREKYGQEKLNEFFGTHGQSFWALGPGQFFPALGGIDHSAVKTYGKPFPELWKEWRDDYSAKEKFFRIDGKQLTLDKLVTYSDLLADNRDIYYIKQEIRKVDADTLSTLRRIMRKNFLSGKEEELVSIISGFVSRPQVFDHYLYYTVYDTKRGYANSTSLGFGYIANLHQKNLKNRKERILFSDTLRAFTLLDKNRILYAKDRADAFGSELWVYQIDKNEHRMILKSDYLIGELTSADNLVIISARRDWENFGIYLFDLNQLALRELVNTPYAETYPVIYQDKVFFVANYEKTYRIYAYDLTRKKISQMTDGDYANFPAVLDDLLYFVGLDNNGTNFYHKPVIYREFTLPEYPRSEVPDLKAVENQLVAKKGGYFNVLKTMLPPSLRLPIISPESNGVYLTGSDITYEHSYSILFTLGKEPLLELLYESRFWKPLTAGIMLNRNSGETDTTLYGTYPLWKKNEPGLTGFDFSFQLRRDEGLTNHNEIVPGITATITYPRWYFQNILNYIAELKSFGSERNRGAVELTSLFSRYFRRGILKNPEIGSEFKVILYLINDPKRQESKELEIRGYPGKNALKVNRGGTLSLEYGFPLLKVRTGFWNPNVYLEDISLVGFGDVAFAQDKSPLSSIGFEFRLEARAAFSLRIIPVIGCALTKDGKSEIYFFMRTTNF